MVGSNVSKRDQIQRSSFIRIKFTCRSIRFADSVLLQEAGHVSSSSRGGVYAEDGHAEESRKDDGQGIHGDDDD